MSFGQVADAYDRARPSYPPDAVGWMTGAGRSLVLELGAGTGKLTEPLHGAGHDVFATDPLPEMLARLKRRVPVTPVVSSAEQIPLRSRSVDLVVCGGSFQWFDHDLALPEIARVLRPGGVLALAWNTYDVTIPWVRRLEALISPRQEGTDQAMPLMETPYFGFVDHRDFRFWQPHTAASLADLARSISTVAGMSESSRAGVLAKVEALYAEYGRGHDGMQLPYVTRCYRAVVRHQGLRPEAPPTGRPSTRTSDDRDGGGLSAANRQPPREDPGTQLIDLR